MCRRHHHKHLPLDLLDDPWALAEARDDRRTLAIMLAAVLLFVLTLGLIRIHDRHKARAAAGELCYQGVGPCEEARP